MASQLYPSKHHLNRILGHLTEYRRAIRQILLKRNKSLEGCTPNQLKQLNGYGAALEELYVFLQLKLSTAAKDVSWLGSGRDKTSASRHRAADLYPRHGNRGLE